MKCQNITTLETSNFMQNIAECQNIAILGGKRLIAYSKLGLIIFKVRVRVNNIFKVRLIAYSKVRVNKLNRDLKVKVSFKKLN